MFDEQLRESLVRRYEHRSSSCRPEYWLVATAPERADQRDWVNKALALVSEPCRSKLWSRLTDDNHFLQTYHELSVAAILQEVSLRPCYEMEFGGQSPDLTILTEDGRPAVLVEVANRMRARDTALADQSWRGLRDRVRAIPAPYGLVIRNASPDLAAPSDHLAKKIARQLEQWLLLPAPTTGNSLEANGYTFNIAVQMLGTNADLIYPQSGRWMNSDDDVAALIKEKVKKYASLARDLEVPLVIVIGADPRVPVDLHMLRSAMRGQLTTSVQLDPLTLRSPTGRMQMHQTDEPPAWDPALSAVGWLTPGIGDPGRISMIPSEQARRPHGLPLGGRLGLSAEGE